MVEVSKISDFISLIDLDAPIPGFKNFLGAYVCRGDRTAVIDPGPRLTIQNLLAGLTNLGLEPGSVDYLLLTHIHLDHAGATGTVIREMPNAKVAVHPRGFKHLQNPAVLWEASRKSLGDLAEKYGEIESVPTDRLIQASDGMTIDLGNGIALEVVFTPGHAPHHMSFFERGSGILFAGSAGGSCSNGLTRPAMPPPYSVKDGLESLDRLIALEPVKICYGHFGGFDDAAERLRAMKDQIVLWRQVVADAAGSTDDPRRIFALIREKDQALAFLDRLSPEDCARVLENMLEAVQGLMSAR